MKTTLACAALLAFLPLAPTQESAVAQTMLSAPAGGQAVSLHEATLYQEDYLRHSLSLRTGDYGKAVQNHLVVNLDSELDFGSYSADQFTAGVQGGQNGELLDLGSWQDLARRHGYAETVGGGQGFTSIRFENGRLVILQDYSTGAVQSFVEGEQFLNGPPLTTSRPAPITVGHVYLVRIVDRNDPEFLRFVKLLVVGHAPGQSVTVRWQELRR